MERIKSHIHEMRSLENATDLLILQRLQTVLQYETLKEGLENWDGVLTLEQQFALDMCGTTITTLTCTLGFSGDLKEEAELTKEAACEAVRILCIGLE